MNSINTLWPVMVVGAMIGLLTFVGGIFAAFAWRGRSSKASNYVLAGIGILGLRWMLGLFGPIQVARAAGAATLGVVSVWMQLVSAILFAVALALLVAAAFVDRHPRSTDRSDVYLPGDRKPASSDANPYAASDLQ